MNDKTLEMKLVEDFPQIFQDHGGDPMKTCMAWGIAVGDGWHDLIRKLCEDIMAMDPPDTFKSEQVKEKFGGLKFYVSGSRRDIDARIHAAELESYQTCERCGSKESVTSEGIWITTLCEKCRCRK